METGDNHATNYRSVLTNWDLKSAVRSKPRRMLSEAYEGLTFFSATLTPPASHELVMTQGNDRVHELLARRLHLYLDFTTTLEQEIVNPVLFKLSRNAYGLKLPADMRFDAHRIYCDEAYHALFSVDVKRQVELCTGIISPNPPTPCFAKTIERTKQTLPKEYRDLVSLCAAVVSETLISGTLDGIPTDPTVVSAIRETMADHAADERTHHAYFTRVLEVAWPQLDLETQRTLASTFADFIWGFLAPDLRAQREMLEAMDFTSEEARRIIEESYPRDVVAADVRHAARSTLRLLERTGVLREPRAIEHFMELRLISDKECTTA